MEGGNKVSLRHFLADRKISSHRQNAFGASYSMSNKLLLIARHYDYGPPKMPLKLAV